MSDKKAKIGEISGEDRKRTHLLRRFEDKLISSILKIIPSWLQTYHLTLSAILTSAAAIYFGYLYEQNKYWLLGIPFVLILHWFTDMMDGEVGRSRNTGLVKWGFYTDHFLDLLFMSSIFIGYTLAFPKLFLLNIFLIIGMSLFFIDSVLFALVGGSYITSGFMGRVGPTEATIILTILGISFVFLPYSVIHLIFLIMTTTLLFAVTVQFYIHQKSLWEEDMRNNKNS